MHQGKGGSIRMQRLLRSLGVALVVSFMTPALLFAATNQTVPTTAAAGAERVAQVRAAGQKATAQRQALMTEKRAILERMKGNSNPETRLQLMKLQMKGGK
jgi:hypothetical protein